MSLGNGQSRGACTLSRQPTPTWGCGAGRAAASSTAGGAGGGGGRGTARGGAGSWIVPQNQGEKRLQTISMHV